MKRIKVKENENLFTAEQREALIICHNKYFEAEMCDSYKIEEKEKAQALAKLKTVLPDVEMFIPDFSTCNDTLIMRGDE